MKDYGLAPPSAQPLPPLVLSVSRAGENAINQEVTQRRLLETEQPSLRKSL